MNELVTIENGKLTTTSRIVAEKFGKRHDNVLRDIRNLECSAEYHALNFEEMIERVKTGKGAERESPVFQITRDGFIFLVTGFTGKDAAQWKEKFITTFNDMEKALESKQTFDPAKALNDPSIMRGLLLNYSEKVLDLEQQVSEMLPQVDALKRISASNEVLTLTQASKVVGEKRNVFIAKLHAAGWIYRQNESWVAYDKYIKNGCLVYKEASYTDESTGLKVIKPYCHITQKGIARLAVEFNGGEAA